MQHTAGRWIVDSPTQAIRFFHHNLEESKLQLGHVHLLKLQLVINGQQGDLNGWAGIGVRTVTSLCDDRSLFCLLWMQELLFPLQLCLTSMLGNIAYDYLPTTQGGDVSAESSQGLT